MSALGVILLSVVAAVWVAAFITTYVAQYLRLTDEDGRASRVGRSLLSAVLWPVVLIAYLIAVRK